MKLNLNPIKINLNCSSLSKELKNLPQFLLSICRSVFVEQTSNQLLLTSPF